ncbi:MAG: aldolase/citrate lyase family protein, partial [Chloroflexota bacterium]|nr:aldolase/citrate lyase family protein [Chloroflexota bacterium]
AEHVKRSNEEILLLVMCEDKKGIENLDAIAAVDGVDVVIVAPTDLSESLGLSGNFDALRKVYQDVATRLRRIGKAKLSVPLGHPSMPFNARELKTMGVVYASVHPPMAARVIRSFKEEVARIRKELE